MVPRHKYLNDIELETIDDITILRFNKHSLGFRSKWLFYMDLYIKHKQQLFDENTIIYFTLNQESPIFDYEREVTFKFSTKYNKIFTYNTKGLNQVEKKKICDSDGYYYNPYKNIRG